METANQIVLWRNSDVPILPKKIEVDELVHTYGLQLSNKDRNQIVKSFQDGSYEMVATYVWTKTINSLKSQLGKMGVSFITEMLDRPDLNESNLMQAISEFEAIQLAEELGVITGTSSFRLKQAMDIVSYFNQPELEEDPENDLNEDDTKTILRSCIQGILGYSKIEAPIDFKNFRSDLEEVTLKEDSPYIYKLVQSPYFFHRTTIRILLSIIKSASGAQLENSLANANLIIPQIWDTLKHPEKYQVGRSYAELFADGQTKASSGLKKVLLKVRGFDFVPEDLRSTSFLKIANEILVAHDGMNNYYHEPAPTNTLAKMGSVIPSPVFSVCITAVLSVKLGNRWGVSISAQVSANQILENITPARWVYFFNECLQTDERILYKLTLSNPTKRWLDLFPSKFIDDILPEIEQRDVINLLKFTRDGRQDKLNKIALEMFVKLGYSK